jgi:signal transduction histidine kinase
MQAVLSNELITATRHEMYDQLEMVGLARTIIARIARSANERGRSQRFFSDEIELLGAQAKYLDDAHIHMNKVMDTIRFSQGEPLSDRTKVNISEVWARAIEPFAYRLDRAHVSRAACVLSPLVNVCGSFDWLRIVFTHLILNSLDAFDRGWAKQRREILLVPGARSKHRLTLRYIDTAGGIEVNELKRHGVLIEDPRPAAIFDRYVTSKPKGTGLGLASCRAALLTMEGSIELVDWKKGATFDIELDSWEDD